MACFITNEASFATNMACFVTNMASFATNMACFVTNAACFVANGASLATHAGTFPGGAGRCASEKERPLAAVRPWGPSGRVSAPHTPIGRAEG
jgi:hypothetical protein